MHVCVCVQVERQKNRVYSALMSVPLPILRQLANTTEKRIAASDQDGNNDEQDCAEVMLCVCVCVFMDV